MIRIVLPPSALVLLMGPSGAGKSTFARRHFRATEIVSSDAFRALACDDEGDMSATDDAFFLVHAVVRMRLARGRLTVVDATNLMDFGRHHLVAKAQEFQRPVVAIAFTLPESVCQDRNRVRTDHHLPPGLISEQHAQLRREMQKLASEGIRLAYELPCEESVRMAEVVRAAAGDVSAQSVRLQTHFARALGA